MDDYKDIVNAIQKRFKAKVADVFPVVTKYDNDPAELPEEGLGAKVNVLFGIKTRQSIGLFHACYRQPGQLIIELQDDLQIEETRIFEVAQLIVDSFRAVTDTVTYRKSDIIRVGREQSKNRINVVVSYTYDLIKEPSPI